MDSSNENTSDGKSENAIPSPHLGYLGLGSSLGNRRQHLRDAIERLGSESDRLRVLAISGLYESPHMGLEPEDALRCPPHLNCALAIETSFTPHELLERVRAVENQGGRQRIERWGPRTIDIDILLYDDLALNSEVLTLPHPGIADRAFVVLPLLDIAPDLVLPNGSRLLAIAQSDSIRRHLIVRVEWTPE